jgi:hypothetical protein
MRLADVVHGLAGSRNSSEVWSSLRWRQLSGRTGEVRSDWLWGAERRGTLATRPHAQGTALGGRFASPAPHCPSTNLLPHSLSYSVSTLFLNLIATRALPNPRPLQVQRVSLNLDKAIDCVLSLDKATPDPNPSGSEREADPIQYCHLADGASPLSLQR